MNAMGEFTSLVNFLGSSKINIDSMALNRKVNYCRKDLELSNTFKGTIL